MEETTAQETAGEKETEGKKTAEGREERLKKIARSHILASMGVGLIPVPLVDVVALMGIQLDMIKKVSAEYDVPFKQDRGKSIITSLIGGLAATEIGFSLGSLIKCLPIVGQTTGAIAMPIISGASTYALHKVFVQHYEEGGTILDLDPAKVKSFFAEQFTQGKAAAENLKAEEARSES